MAANKIATVIHRNSNKITLILIYAFLEWLLIFLLLLHALFSYLILKFADSFGLNRPCFFCSRLDHVFEPHKTLSHTDLLCQPHAMEVSNLGYSSNHPKLTDTRDFCGVCSSDQNEGLMLCSCCGESFKNRLIKPSWGDLDYAPLKWDFISEAEIDAQSDEINVAGNRGTSIVSGEKQGEKDDMGTENDGGYIELGEDLSSCDRKTIEVGCERGDPHHLEFYIARGDDPRLIPVDSIDFSASETDNSIQTLVQELEDCGNDDVVLDFGSHFEILSVSLNQVEDPSMEVEEEEDAEVSIDTHKDELEEFVVAAREPDSDLHQDFRVWNDELEVEISIGTDIPDHEPIDEIQTQNDLPSESDPDVQEYPSLSSSVEVDNMQDFNKTEKFEESEEAKEEVEFKILSVETSSQPLNEHKPSSSELNENEEEDRVPDTPNSIDSLHQLHKKLLLLDRKEYGAEESLDGSVVSETEGGDGVSTIEKLKSALRIERKVLNALYLELEEERSASAIAANQTMAMINRLQEEKASMKMEALQYQRMMEEQSEYDQEALQLLNELAVKREKEKLELEKEIEVYRKKLQDYEAKDKIVLLLRNRKEGSIQSRNSSVSCSNAEDSDGLSIDLNTEAKKDRDVFSNQETNNQTTPTEAVLYLEETLTNFEEERLSILEELKMLEEKLFTLSDEEQQSEDVEHYCEPNGNGYHKNSDYATERNGFENGHHVKEMNGNHYPERRTMSTKAKGLLPLFDDLVNADVEDASNGEEQGFDSVSMQKFLDHKFDTEFRRVAVEEEVDRVYERLQALEADREFLKHCIGSLRKGDKGLELLQEILQHLRDLRSVDRQLKNMGDSVLA